MRVGLLVGLLVLTAQGLLAQVLGTTPKPLTTTFLHQTLGESIEDFMRISGTKMFESNKPQAPDWCAAFKKAQQGEDATIVDREKNISASLVFSGKKLVQVVLKGTADWSKSMEEMTQKYGAPDAKGANSASWSFSDGGGIDMETPANNQFTAIFYSKERKPQGIDGLTQTVAQSSPVPVPKVIDGHIIGESVDEFATKLGVDLVACRQLNFSAKPSDLEKQAMKLHVAAQTCKGLVTAEQGGHVEIGKEYEWSAVLDGKKLLSFNNGHVDTDKIISADKLPPAPSDAFELKGDKLGMSMAEYLQRHPSDCVALTLNPKPTKSGPKPTDPNAFHFTCTNFSTRSSLTLANESMQWETLDFSQQRLYRVFYAFSHDFFEVIAASFAAKFGPPSKTEEQDLQNGFGARFKRETVTWKNGISTITLKEVIANDLTVSGVEVTLDDLYSAVQKKEIRKEVSAAQSDM